MTKALELGLVIALAHGRSTTAVVQKPSSPGMRLTYVEKSRETKPGLGEVVNGGFHTEGFPESQTYSLSGRWMTGRSAEVAKGLRIDSSGRVIGRDGEPIGIALGAMFPREYVVFILAAEDGSAKAEVEVTPFPIQAEGMGGCRLSVRPLTPTGEMFSITGSGFEPDRQLKTVSTSSGETAEQTTTGRSDGTLKYVLFPAVVGKTGGDASFSASDSSCSVSVAYKWGDAMRGSSPRAARPNPVARRGGPRVPNRSAIPERLPSGPLAERWVSGLSEARAHSAAPRRGEPLVLDRS